VDPGLGGPGGAGIRERIARGSALNVVAVLFNQGSTLAASIAVARLLYGEAFGAYAIVQNTLLVMANLSQLATGYTASRYVAEYRTSDRERAGRILGLCGLVATVLAGLMAFVLVAAAPWLSDAMLNAPDLSTPLRIGAGFMLFTAINGYQSGALIGLEAYGSLARAGVWSGLGTVATVSVGAWWGGLAGALWGLSAGALLRCLIHGRRLGLECAAHSIRPRYWSTFDQDRAIVWSFALPAAIAGYLSLPMIWLASTLLVRQPGGLREMALFSAANNLRLLLLFLPGVVNSVGLSVLNHEKGRGDVDHHMHVFRGNVLSMVWLCIVSAVILGASSGWFLLLFGDEFSAARALVWCLLGAGVLEGITIGLYQLVQSKGRMWLSVFGVSVPRDLSLVASAYLLVPRFGGEGLAGSYLVSYALGLVCVSLLVLFLSRERGATLALSSRGA
jgi:O-antigen/teichoic acid export membrane protein